ncbi:pyrroline-5-carboxylate reductase [Legionella shakespearei]|uniref:Pyrroline-5-carboxylate reductase n=1 Tax=Legionella shakespearei DSM 23087 TaxID=1122169 RepID=A0A0W0ZB94_9GAMM|nr:pyrroline-5-carboxylate reductase [Legionella shakespearei]KTD66417.1 pyrroline-5-carboxylate reductase [Legionella shakespearei DSM 23087]
MKICFIGYGNMAKAIARGLRKQGSHHIAASAPSLTIGINNENISTHYDNKEQAKNAEIIILAVKPAQMSAVLQEITPLLLPNCLLISVAAGLSLSWFAKRCRPNQAVIRTMPNTPAAISLGATPLIANEHTSPEQKIQAELIFSQIGLTAWAKSEAEMDVFTALSGSGPAYVFLFIEALIDAAVSLGLEPTIAKTFALQTAAGAIKLAENSDLSLSQLRTKVTSPGGTTAAALNELHGQLDALILKAMEAAKRRSQELGAVE